jgi:uncharacterized protein
MKEKRVINICACIFFVLALFLGASGPAVAEVKMEPVTGAGFEADLYLPPGASDRPGVIVLGGSEGGKPADWAKRIAAAGYPALCVAYFKTKTTPATLELIPLEYFKTAIDWFLASGKARPGGVIVFGGSKGAELALLLAARVPEIKGVIAIAPSAVVWQGLPAGWWPIPPALSSWSEHNAPVPFVPYDYSVMANAERLVDFYRGALGNKAAVEAAAIPVENINGPILLLAGAEDTLWPSAEMAGMIAERLKRSGFAHRFERIVFPDAGHSLNEAYLLGGTVAGNKNARLKAWETILDFLKTL